MMNHPEVKLIMCTPDAERVVASAARLCYASDVSVIFENSGTEDFLKRLRDMNHMSPFEHVSYTFLLEGVSRALTHQLVRHRIASYSQRSQRYVGHDNFEYIIPPSFIGKTVKTAQGETDAVEYFKNFMDHASEVYSNLLESLGGKSEDAKQDARYVLPNAAETKILVTMNARELFHFFGERLCSRAQWEIRETAQIMLELAKGVSPGIFYKTGPKCVQSGKCPEGKKTCGQMEAMRKKYISST